MQSGRWIVESTRPGGEPVRWTYAFQGDTEAARVGKSTTRKLALRKLEECLDAGQDATIRYHDNLSGGGHAEQKAETGD